MVMWLYCFSRGFHELLKVFFCMIRSICARIETTDFFYVFVELFYFEIYYFSFWGSMRKYFRRQGCILHPFPLHPPISYVRGGGYEKGNKKRENSFNY
jgi:hypothetical protein